MNGRFDRGESSFFINSRAQRDDRRMAMAARQDLFRRAKDQLYRSAGRFRQRVSDGNINKRRLRSEIAADVNDMNIDLLLSYAEIQSHLVA